MITGRFLRITPLLAAMALISSCQSGGQSDGSAIDFGLGGESKPAEEQITDTELRAFCPRVQLREGTAFFNTFTKGNENNPNEIIYQATLSDATRTCQYGGGVLTMNVTAAGRIVPGPQGRSGTITMPIRVAVVDTTGVLYSELRKMDVSFTAGVGAQQFLFQDANVSIPQPETPTARVFIGFDEGPYDTP